MYTTLIDAPRLIDHLRVDQASTDWVVIDCRFSLTEPEAGLARYLEGHVPGARYAHLDDDLSAPIVPGVSGRHPLPDRDLLERRFRDFGIHPHTAIVCYDDSHGAIASRLWWLSRWLGHSACALLDGGMAAWQRAGGPLADGAELPVESGSFSAGSSLVETADIDTVASPLVLPVDAREPERHAGRSEPIDPVAGHIPGAVNLPFAGNLDEHHAFLPAETLRARFEPLVRQAGERRLVHYCGSGVTAAHNVLAMAHAGLDAGALYPGSWSEWISRDAERYPVATLDD